MMNEECGMMNYIEENGSGLPAKAHRAAAGMGRF